MKLLRLVDLQAAGYRIKNNDLTLEEWLDLGRVKKIAAQEIPPRGPDQDPGQDPAPGRPENMS